VASLISASPVPTDLPNKSIELIEGTQTDLVTKQGKLGSSTVVRLKSLFRSIPFDQFIPFFFMPLK
jgi:hypothetical protein